MSVRSLALGFSLLLGGCFELGPGEECTVDDDCGGSLACTRTHECVSGTLIDAEVHWTIAGAPASASACSAAGIDHLATTFIDTATDENITYSPVPCLLGQATYDKMPPRFDQVSLSALDAGDGALDGQASGLQPGLNVIDFDLSP